MIKKTVFIKDDFYYPSEESKEIIKKNGLEWLIKPGQMIEDPAATGQGLLDEVILKSLGWMDEFVVDFGKNEKIPTAVFEILDKSTGKHLGIVSYMVGCEDLKRFKTIVKN